MANTLKTTTWMAKEFLRHFENNNTFSKFVNKTYGKDFLRSDMRPGTSIKIPKPARFTATSGATASFPDLTEEECTLTVAQYNASFAPTGVELTTATSNDDFSDRYLKPMAVALASQVDKDGLDLVRTAVYNSSGTPGTTPETFLKYSTARAIALENLMPAKGDCSIVINPIAEATITDAMKGLFHSSSEIERQYKEGTMGLAIGAKWSMDQLVSSHTSGQRGGTPLMNGATATGATTIVTDGWTAAAANRVKAGDVFTIAAVYNVNPVTKVSTGRLKQFVVTADTSSDGSGNATIPISPTIYSSTSTTLQNVDALPADNAALTFVSAASTLGTHNVLFHKDAFGLASIPMNPLGPGSESTVMTDPDTGISVVITKGADVTNYKQLIRADVLYGWVAMRPEWACRVEG